MEGMSYSIFKVGARSMLWAKDIEQKQLQAHRFIDNFIRKAVSQILERLLWMDPKHALSIIHVSNFWVLDEQLYLLEMPRMVSLRKTENTRSYSHEPVSITTIIDKEMSIIKKVAECLWEILFPNQLNQLKEKQFQSSRLLLTKMINRQLSFQEILTEIQQPVLDPIAKVKRHRFESPLRKELFSRKKHSEPLSLILNTGKKKRNSLHSLTSPLMSKVSAQDKKFEFKRRCTTLPVPQPAKSLMGFNR